MGGGFYDRTFSFTHTDQKNKPLIAGIAYSFQQLEKLEAASWDVRLGKIFTEQSVVDTE
jgi:5-formyltetrahydrofolate cyclo-ligase